MKRLSTLHFFLLFALLALFYEPLFAQQAPAPAQIMPQTPAPSGAGAAAPSAASPAPAPSTPSLMAKLVSVPAKPRVLLLPLSLGKDSRVKAIPRQVRGGLANFVTVIPDPVWHKALDPYFPAVKGGFTLKSTLQAFKMGDAMQADFVMTGQVVATQTAAVSLALEVISVDTRAPMFKASMPLINATTGEYLYQDTVVASAARAMLARYKELRLYRSFKYTLLQRTGKETVGTINSNLATLLKYNTQLTARLPATDPLLRSTRGLITIYQNWAAGRVVPPDLGPLESAYDVQNDLGGTVTRLKAIYSANPFNYFALFYLGTAYLAYDSRTPNQKALQAAAKTFQTSFEKNYYWLTTRNKALILNNWASTLFRLKDYRGSAGIYKKMIGLVKKLSAPDFLARGYFNNGLSLIKIKGMYPQAVASFQQVITTKIRASLPIKAQDYFWLGLSQYYSGNFVEAIAAYNKAIELDPNYAVAYYNRASARSALGLQFGDASKINAEIRSDKEKYSLLTGK